MDLVVERVIDGASAIPAEVIILYAWTKLLDMRDARVFWAVGLAYSCTMVLVRSSIDADIRPVVSVVLSLFYYFAFPLAFSRGKVVSRSFVCVAVFAIIMMAELMGGGLWVMMTGTLAGDNDAVPGHFAAFWFVRVVHLLILVTLFALLYRFVREIPSKAHQTGLEWFVGFPASQLLLLVALAFLGARLSFEGQADAFDVGKVLWGGASYCQCCACARMPSCSSPSIGMSGDLSKNGACGKWSGNWPGVWLSTRMWRATSS